MALEFIGSPEQIQLVHALADQAYEEYAEANHFLSSKQVYKGPYCSEITFMLIEKLKAENYSPLPRQYGFVHRHVYLGNDWIADPTWQQFPLRVDKSVIPTLPKVIVAQLAYLPKILSDYQIVSEYIRYWVDARV